MPFASPLPVTTPNKCAIIVVSGSARLTLKARQLRLIYFAQSTGTKQNLLCIPGRSFTEGRLSLVVIHQTYLRKEEEEARADGVPFLY
jgi:hypothetical protein